MKKWVWVVSILLLLYLIAIPVVSIVQTLYIGIPPEASIGMTMPLYKETLVVFLIMMIGIVIELFIKKKKGYLEESTREKL